MSKRNFILLIIVLVIIGVIAFVFFSSTRPTATPAGNEGGTNFFAKFNPFRKNTPTATPSSGEPPADISGNEPPPETAETEIKLRKISSMPIAGFGVFIKERLKEVPPPTPEEVITEKPATKVVAKKPTPLPTEFTPSLRYVDRATGNIYQTFADKINEQKFSVTIIPRVHEAYFGDKAESVVMRYLKEDNITINTFAGSLPKEVLGADNTGSNELKGVFLPENIADMSVSPDLLKIFYLFKVAENTIGITADVVGDKKVQVFSSPFTEWNSQWPNKDMITLTTKPSASIPGYMYAVNPTKKDLNRILGNINGLTILTSPDGKLVLYGDNNLSLYVYNIATKNSDSLGVKTLPEKCTWGKASDIVYCAVPKFIDEASFPDDWYKGGVSFSDNIWEIDLVNENENLILAPDSEPGGEDIDGIKLKLDKDENYLFFVNKKDSFLWEFKLR